MTSVSVDLHKYAYCPKGVSVLLHRDAALRAPQYFAYADWPGYTMVNPTVASTRSGGPIAAAFATLRHLGDDGYLRLAAATAEAVRGARRPRWPPWPGCGCSAIRICPLWSRSPPTTRCWTCSCWPTS